MASYMCFIVLSSFFAAHFPGLVANAKNGMGINSEQIRRQDSVKLCFGHHCVTDENNLLGLSSCLAREASPGQYFKSPLRFLFYSLLIFAPQGKS